MIWALLYLLTIVGANWAIQTFGLVPVGFGLMSPAGVYLAGLVFTLRDLVQEALGRRWVVGLIVAGAALSWLVSPAFALASGAVFLVSETADFLVYQPLRTRNWPLAVLLSNTVGLLIDTALFLWLAFGSLEFLPGAALGKLWVTLATVAVLYPWRRRRAREAQA